MKTQQIDGVIIQTVGDDFVSYVTDYAPDNELHERVAKAFGFGDRWVLTGLGAIPRWDMNSAGTANWLIEKVAEEK